MQLNLLDYFWNGALRTHPAKVAIEDNGTATSFQELRQHALRCAAAIQARTGSLNEAIAVLLPKGTATIVADLGILCSGNCYTNLDVKSPAQRIRNVVENVGPALLITSRDLAEAAAGLGVAPDRLLFVEDFPGAAYDAEAILCRLEKVIDTDPACIINTSGSTGTPKSVVLNHRSIIDFMDWLFGRFGFGPEERIGSLSPFHFDIYTLELWYTLAKGSTFVIIPEQHGIFPTRLVEFLASERISFLFWVPTVMVNISNQDTFAAAKPKALRNVLFAGEVFPTRHFNYWRRHFPEALFVNLYGPIEITVDCTYYAVDREFADEDPLPIGFPCRNTDILILDEDGRPAPPGTQGELCVRGTSLAMGYWNDPEKTRKAFVQNPLNTRYPELIYRTGDLVHLNAAGEILFDGRKDFQVKHLGYRIELGEIEHVLVNSVEDIANACVLYDRDRKEIVLVFESARQVTPAEIRKRLQQVLPKYMLPTVFHQVEAMVRNPNGKIDRKRLQEEFLG
ncbi:amino acid adenylation domain-containing protein [Geothrix sp. 21YS21S-2]|uniref:amino acid adenylation domain-containing protein n=1 Tax=Geothrix sp. 21YS21S-2 TaxID=3068893 RepID=UPI0027B8AD9F|nr:amino acid adenylation domain-containing protein [Geothrix sp. 21YS21S-2]